MADKRDMTEYFSTKRKGIEKLMSFWLTRCSNKHFELTQKNNCIGCFHKEKCAESWDDINSYIDRIHKHKAYKTEEKE